MCARPDHHAGAGQRGRAPARWRAAAAVTAVVAAAALSLAVGAVPASAVDGYTVTATIPVGSLPDGVAVDPAAGTVYVTNGGDSDDDGTVSVIDAATLTVTATITVGLCPDAVAVNLGTDAAYVANTGGTVSVISLEPAGSVSGPIVSGSRAGTCVADSGDSAANDTPITLDTCNGSPSQDWTVTTSRLPAALTMCSSLLLIVVMCAVAGITTWRPADASRASAPCRAGLGRAHRGVRGGRL